MSAAVIMGMLGCSCSAAVGMFYTCTDGTWDLSNVNANSCLSFLTSNCAANTTPTPVNLSIDCQYIAIEQTTANAIILSDIHVEDVLGGDLIKSVAVEATPTTPAEAASFVEGHTTENGLASFIDPETSGTATIGTVTATDATTKARLVVDLGGLKKVHKVVLTNTATVADQSKIGGAKVLFYGSETVGTTTSKKKIKETPVINFVANTYTYRFTSEMYQSWK